MKIGFVCTNYNNSSDTREAVCSLLKNSGHEFRVVIVDNHSDIQSVEELKDLAGGCPQIDLILNQENVGYFKGLNMGIRHLRSNGTDHPELVVIGNNDLVFPSGFVDSLQRNVPIFEKYAVVSPDIVTLDGVHQNPHVIGRISKLREFVYDLYYANYYLAIAIRQIAKWSQTFTDRADESHHDIAQEIYQGYGACYVIGPVFFRHFQELWAPTFMLHEEYFLSRQLSEEGLRLYYEPSICVLHRCHGAMKALTSRKAWEAARTAQKVYRKYVKVFN